MRWLQVVQVLALVLVEILILHPLVLWLASFSQWSQEVVGRMGILRVHLQTCGEASSCEHENHMLA